MYQWLIILALIITLTISGCGDSIAKREEKMLLGPHYSQDKEKVKEIQLILMYAGFDSGDIDGIMGFYTRKVLREFQESLNLSSSGYVGKDTWTKMKKIREDEGPFNAKDIQFAIRNAGFNPGSIDGKFGVQTRDAIAAFQIEKKLEVTHSINPETWSELKKHFPKDKINQ